MSQQPTNLKDRLIKDSTGEGSGTRLRSLKYGRDREGGGNSREPFITESLPGVEEDNPNIGLLGNGDFLLRAGSLERSLNDVVRLTKYFTTGKGLGFVAKQNLLSRTNVKPQGGGILNQGIYLPTNTLAQAGVSFIGGHLVKQGINPFRDLSVNPLNEQDTAPSGDGFFQKALGTVKKGLQAADNATTFPLYLNQVTSDQEDSANRLVQLRSAKIAPKTPNGASAAFARALNFATIGNNLTGLLGLQDPVSGRVQDKVPDLSSNNPSLSKLNISTAKGEILSYGGGPGSFLGIGKTIIKRASDTNAYNTESFRSKYYLLDAGTIQQKADLVVNNPGKILPDFRFDVFGQQNKGQKKNILSAPVDYTTKNIETRVGLGDPGKVTKDLSSYTQGLGEKLDKVNGLPLYESSGVTANALKNDLVKFRFSVPDTNNPRKRTYIHFRAFLDGFTDNYTSNYETLRYMGRTDPLYRFQGFERNVVLSWTIAAQSREELMVMYTKLNYLQSVMTGDYTSKGYFAGNVVNLTVGGYFWETPGVITSMNISVPNESPWEIGLPDSEESTGFNSRQTIPTDLEVREMPHIIQVTGFAFNPIHDFAPRKQQNQFGPNGELEEFGKEAFIALKSEAGKSIFDSDDVGATNPNLSFRPTTAAKVLGNGIRSLQTGAQKLKTTGPQASPFKISAPSSISSKKSGGLPFGG